MRIEKYSPFERIAQIFQEIILHERANDNDKGFAARMLEEMAKAAIGKSKEKHALRKIRESIDAQINKKTEAQELQEKAKNFMDRTGVKLYPKRNLTREDLP